MTDGLLDFVDAGFVRAAPAQVRAELDRPAVWSRAWSGWPGLDVEVVQDRGVKGMRLRVTGAARGRAEVWLEEYREATVVHHFFAVTPSEDGLRMLGPWRRRTNRRAAEAHLRAWKSELQAIKDRLEAGGGDRGQ